jgi:hypothetical protein
MIPPNFLRTLPASANLQPTNGWMDEWLIDFSID